MRDGPFPAHYEPFESAGRQRDRARRSAATRRRACSRTTWRQFGDAEGVPVRGDHLPADRALPLLDQARRGQRDPAAGVLRRDRRGAREGEGHREGRLGEGVVEPRLGQGQGGRHQAHQAADVRRQDRAHRRHSAPLGLHGRWRKKGFGANSLTPFVGDANIETPEFKAFLVDIEPIDGAGGMREDAAWPRFQSARRRSRRSATGLTRRAAASAPARRSEVAKLIDVSKCIGCKACQVGVPGVERPARGGRRQRRRLRQPARPDAEHVRR